jgi:hypothetical protein
MTRTKTIEVEPLRKPMIADKIIEVDEVEGGVLELEEKPEVGVVPGVETEEEDPAEEEALLDTEEIDPFGDTWEQ